MKSLSTKEPTSCTSGDAGAKRPVQKVGGSEHETSYFLHCADAARLVAVPMGKGCVLYLTPAEYRAGIRRGKMIRRADATARRLARMNATPADKKLSGGNVGARTGLL
jgi:hypothetical protein